MANGNTAPVTIEFLGRNSDVNAKLSEIVQNLTRFEGSVGRSSNRVRAFGVNLDRTTARLRNFSQAVQQAGSTSAISTQAVDLQRFGRAITSTRANFQEFSALLKTARTDLNQFTAAMGRGEKRAASFSAALVALNPNLRNTATSLFGVGGAANYATASVNRLGASSRTMAGLGNIPQQLQAAINGLTQSMGRLNQMTANTQGRIRSLGGVSNLSTASLRNLALQFIGVGSAAMVARAGFDNVVTFGKTMSAVGAISEANAADFAMMENAARKLGQTTVFSANEAAGGLKMLAQAGYTAKQSTEALTGIMNLAQAGDLGMAEAADIATSSLATFNMQAKDAAKVGDTLAMAANVSNVDVRNLGESLKFVGPIASALGQDLGEVTAALGVLGNAGIKAEMGGTALRQILTALAVDGTKHMEALNEIGVTFEEINPATHSLIEIFDRLREANISAADAFRIFGVRGQVGFNVINSAIPKLHELNAKIQDSGGSAERVAQQMTNNLWGSLKKVGGAFGELSIAIGKSGLEQSMVDILNKIREMVTAATPMIASLTPEVLGLVGVFIKLWAALKVIQLGQFAIGLAKTTGTLVAQTATVAANTAAWVANTAAKAANAVAGGAGAAGAAGSAAAAGPVVAALGSVGAIVGVAVASWGLTRMIAEAVGWDEVAEGWITQINGLQGKIEKLGKGNVTTLVDQLKLASNQEEKHAAINDLIARRNALNRALNSSGDDRERDADVRAAYSGEMALIEKVLSRTEQLAGTKQKAAEQDNSNINKNAQGIQELTEAMNGFGDSIEGATSKLSEQQEKLREMADEVGEQWNESLDPSAQLTLAEQKMEDLMKSAQEKAAALVSEHGADKLALYDMPTTANSQDEIKAMFTAMQNFKRGGDHTAEAMEWGQLLKDVLATEQQINSLEDKLDQKAKAKAQEERQALELKRKQMANLSELKALEAEAVGDDKKAEAIRDQNSLLEEQQRLVDDLGLSEVEAANMAARKLAAEKAIRDKKKLADAKANNTMVVSSMQEVGGGGNIFVPKNISTAAVAAAGFSPNGNPLTTPNFEPGANTENDRLQLLRDSNKYLEEIAREIKNGGIYIRKR